MKWPKAPLLLEVKNLYSMCGTKTLANVLLVNKMNRSRRWELKCILIFSTGSILGVRPDEIRS